MRIDDPIERGAMRRLHRRASDVHDDEPDPRIRTTVLAAAARALEARPHTIGERSRRSRRWPWSAAALLVVSVMTGLVVTQTIHDEPDRVVGAAPPVTMPAPAAVTALRSPAAPVAAPADRRGESMPERTTGRGTVDAGKRAAVPVAKPKAATPPAAAASIARPDPPPETTVATPALANPAPTAPSGAPAPVPRSSNEASAPRDATTANDSDRSLASSTALRGSALLRARIVSEPATPEAWLDRIASLRAAGRDTEADREIDALHARYPSFAIPDGARRRASP